MDEQEILTALQEVETHPNCTFEATLVKQMLKHIGDQVARECAEIVKNMPTARGITAGAIYVNRDEAVTAILRHRGLT